MTGDLGAQAFKINGKDAKGNPMGVRSDGARVVIRSADANNQRGELHNTTPTLAHKYYFYGAWGDGPQADRRIAAAERLQEYFYDGGLSLNVCGSLEPHSGAHGAEMTDGQVHHRDLWNKAVQAVGQRYSNDLIMVICYDIQPNELGQFLVGLDRLVDHFGLLASHQSN